MHNFWNLGYLFASGLFIFGIKFLKSPETARRGNLLSIFGMSLALVTTFVIYGFSNYVWIFAALVFGSTIGFYAAKLVKMTALPQMIALFNGFGGLASLLVGCAEFIKLTRGAAISHEALLSLNFAVIIGGITFTGSLIAFAKLSSYLSQRPISFGLVHLYANRLFLAYLIVVAFCLAFFSNASWFLPMFISVVALSLLLGVLFALPIGGADMPIVISLLNSYSGLAACATGFIILNTALIVAGALVGASGFVLTMIMCKAMNRSLSNVLLGNFDTSVRKKSEIIQQGETHPISLEDAYVLLEAAQNILIVPGYGMAIAQAQHAVKELGEMLEARGAEVRYGIHPVAGRMPGHMNVLLAEANVPYEKLYRPEDINPLMDSFDVCIVVGANDVTNPAAKDEPGTPVYGMPIIEAFRAKTVLVLKRSLSPGFSGIDNTLFYRDNTRILFEDAKTSLLGLVSIFKET